MENYNEFLTNEDMFRLEMETYLPEFLQRMENDTMQEADFVQRTVKMMKLAESIGIDLQQYIIDYGKTNGLS